MTGARSSSCQVTGPRGGGYHRYKPCQKKKRVIRNRTTKNFDASWKRLARSWPDFEAVANSPGAKAAAEAPRRHAESPTAKLIAEAAAGLRAPSSWAKALSDSVARINEISTGPITE